MKIDSSFWKFVDAHRDDDCARLLLQRDKYHDVDVELAVRQIEAQREAKVKWPWLLECGGFLFPPKLNREQSSSEVTARLKTSIAETCLGEGEHRIADLTGGMGVDALMMASSPQTKVSYVEQDETLCRLMTHNVKTLGISNIEVHNAESMAWLENCGTPFDLLFVDPARRDLHGKKVSAFEDCRPDILRHLGLLTDRSRWLMVKASPMADITQSTRQLGKVVETHVVAVEGECKELLFVCGERCGESRIVCHDLRGGCDETFIFFRSEEANAEAHYGEPGDYLLEPNAAMMKAGPFKTVCARWGVTKLDVNTHLYSSDVPVPDFHGRQFRVMRRVKLNKKNVQEAVPSGMAHVVTRNYPVAAAQLLKQLGLQEGGELFLIATRTMGRPVGLLCERLHYPTTSFL